MSPCESCPACRRGVASPLLLEACPRCSHLGCPLATRDYSAMTFLDLYNEALRRGTGAPGDADLLRAVLTANDQHYRKQASPPPGPRGPK